MDSNFFQPYNYENLKCIGHTIFINNMPYSEVKYLFTRIYNEVNAPVLSSGPIDSHDYSLKNAIISYGLSGTSICINKGKIDITQSGFDQICVIKLEDLSYADFQNIYSKIRSYHTIALDQTLSDACPEYFYWRGL